MSCPYTVLKKSIRGNSDIVCFYSALSDDLDDMVVDDKEFNELLCFFQLSEQGSADGVFKSGQNSTTSWSPTADLHVLLIKILHATKNSK